MVAEDHRFFLHKGVDHVAILRAVVCNLKGRREGGSTLEQQVVRVLTGDYRLKVGRKLREMALATRIGEQLSKEQLLRLYLEIAYFGKDAIGVAAIAKKLGFDPAGMSSDEAAQVAACIKYPYASGESEQRAERRVKRVERIMKRHRGVENARSAPE
ncbi:biosynthetic peptidoglycan transglycosylase [Cupriavidus sp. USMAA2-4]|uniref:biosynthetic peptidoglycan transglycosylase n=1 Tax=Cupriavidus sp. USMAA2-4 TaxID=876364 RepID=UPI001E2844C7|nr:biosynthetic peptidoglycan transglycosylase [Cupriavidus sp. USMAA2-4]